ncbi:SDR family NAD(P)-dependent oxidoreductase [Sediminibacterium sp.]|uniref:SDR family NAD(P)-dependent oxidoreductase n=1 Tax=Sediminibacterium sp. TaxID=1917865 RepID=UPI0027233AD6|nr:SDR family NAD(P)-dependent oxidoreductase [Sediminibacterium sp.]MDO9000636.1 SDR family NAD(P)-dependent oxidoreductase [Bacteroidota bacterium]MDP3146796.1 SDR family NAD(P)-dependent oxidoreductase [Bacteroidota bacterium]MDP3567658.1 SDR family NAD(P)-dependent oxidoreductase [Sediminibacterium sp.]
MKKTILITGAGTGIGKATAFELARKGHDVIATTETEEQSLDLKNEIKSANILMEVFKLDITNKTDRKKIENYNLDVLINNAGIGESGSLAEIDINKVRNNFEVNVFSTLEISQLALKKMLVRKQGTIIFISSLAGRITMPFLGPYCMTKFALSSGAETLRREIHRVRENVHISIIEPGGYHTGFNQKNIAKKYVWMNEQSVFYSIIDKIKIEEEKLFKFTESKTTTSIVQKIVKAAEAKKPKLRYSAPWWQAVGTQLLRIFGK